MPAGEFKTKYLPIILGAVALALALLTLPRFGVGFWSDDARDILAAQSILHGHYAYWQLPNHPAANFPLPGFPLILAPAVALLAPHWIYLKSIPLIFTVAGLFLAYRWLGKTISPIATIVFMILIALNPSTITLSTQVIADAAYLFFLMTALMAFTPPDTADLRSKVVFVSASTAAAWTRPEGFGLLLACGFVAWTSRRSEDRRLTLTATALGILPLLANRVRTGAFIGYESFARESWPWILQHPCVFLLNAGKLLQSLGLEVLLGIDTSYIPAGYSWLALILVIGILTLMIAGIVRAWSVRGERVAVVYFMFHLALHTLWLAQHPHYLWPLLPLAAFFTVRGLDASSPRWKSFVLWTVGVALAALYGVQAVHAVRATPQGKTTVPTQTFEWIKNQTPPESYFLAPQSAALTLYTQRYSRTLIQASEEDEFYATLLENQITHVLLQPTGFLHVQTEGGRDPGSRWKQYDSWSSGNPLRFTLIYEQPSEHIKIYRVLLNDRFTKAYQRYRTERGRVDEIIASKEGWTRHLVALEGAMSLEAFPSVVNAYAVAALLSGQKRLEAIQALEKSLRTRPDYFPARLNLARLYAKMGKSVLARSAYALAAREASKDPNGAHWNAQIEREINQID